VLGADEAVGVARGGKRRVVLIAGAARVGAEERVRAVRALAGRAERLAVDADVELRLALAQHERGAVDVVVGLLLVGPLRRARAVRLAEARVAAVGVAGPDGLRAAAGRRGVVREAVVDDPVHAAREVRVHARAVGAVDAELLLDRGRPHLAGDR